jgi:DNA-binding FrmR family transcriptional regulator
MERRRAPRMLACRILPTSMSSTRTEASAAAPSRHSYTKDRAQLLRRLSRMEGQVRGVARMIEDERYCIDVLTQIRAVRAALDKVEQETLGDHLKHCVAHAFHAGSEGDRQTKIDELLQVLDSRRR